MLRSAPNVACDRCGILYSVFASNQKANGISTKIMVSYNDRTPEELRQLASKHKFRDGHHRLRAIVPVIENRLSGAL